MQSYKTQIPIIPAVFWLLFVVVLPISANLPITSIREILFSIIWTLIFIGVGIKWFYFDNNFFVIFDMDKVNINGDIYERMDITKVTVDDKKIYVQTKNDYFTVPKKTFSANDWDLIINEFFKIKAENKT